MIRQHVKSYWFSPRLKVFSFLQYIPLCDVPFVVGLSNEIFSNCVC